MWENDVLVLHYYKSTIDGVMTSMIDTFFNLRTVLQSHKNVKFEIICPELYLLDNNDYYDENQVEWYEYTDKVGLNVKPYEANDVGMDFHFRAFRNELTTAIPFLRFNRNFGDFNLIHSIVQDKNVFSARTVICSARLIYEILMGADIEIKCNKLIVLDSLDTYKSKVGIFPDFDDLFDTMFYETHVSQLSNPANFKETRYKQVEYYHKFNVRRLRALKQSGYFKQRYIFNRTNKEKTMIGEGAHFENMGKGIFEHLWFDIPVDYRTEGMFTKDGLWYYLKLVDIDPDKDQTITKNQVDLNKFIMKEDIKIGTPFKKQKSFIEDSLIKEIL
jgi:hypothetical protein